MQVLIVANPFDFVLSLPNSGVLNLKFWTYYLYVLVSRWEETAYGLHIISRIIWFGFVKG